MLAECCAPQVDRAPRAAPEYRNWHRYFAQIRHDSFRSSYRMTKSAFIELMHILGHRLETQDAAKAAGSIPVPTEIHLACTLRYLSGAMYQDVQGIFGLPAVMRQQLLKYCGNSPCNENLPWREFDTERPRTEAISTTRRDQLKDRLARLGVHRPRQ